MTQSAGSLWKIGRQLARKTIPIAVSFGIAASPVTASVAQAKTWLQQVIGNQNKNKYPDYPPPGYNGGYGGGWQGQPYYAPPPPPEYYAPPPPVYYQSQPQNYCPTNDWVTIRGFDQQGGIITNPPVPPQDKVDQRSGRVYAPCY